MSDESGVPDPAAVLRAMRREAGLTYGQLAKRMDVARSYAAAIVAGRKPITARIAHRLARGFPGTSPEFWLDLQSRADLETVGSHR